MAQINKFFLGFTFVACVSAASILEPCRRPACPSPEALFPHTRYCTKYFHCAYSIPFEKSCPSGLYFSPDLLRCDFPSIANCLADPSNPCVAPTTGATQPPSTDGGHVPNASSNSASPHQTSPSVSPGTEPASSETPEDCRPACPTPEALLAHPRDCGKYYHCAFSIAYEKVCPAGLYFSVRLSLCDYPELTQCTATEDAPCDAVITVTPPEQPRNQTGASQARVKRDVTLSSSIPPSVTIAPTLAPNGTASLSLGPNGTPSPSLGPNGTPSPSLGPHGTVVTTEALNSTTSQVAVCNPKCEGGRYLYSHPWYCDKYILCSNYEAIVMNCPEGLHFSIARWRCDYPYIAQCFASPGMPCYLSNFLG